MKDGTEVNMETYRSGHNGADSKCGSRFGTSKLKNPDVSRVLRLLSDNQIP